MKPEIKNQKRIRLHKRIRSKIQGSKDRPRLSVFRSSSHIYAQLIDDDKNKVLASASDLDNGKKKVKKGGKVAAAYEVGQLIAEKAKKIKIEKVVFDRGGFVFHGKIKSLAQGARDGGLKF